MGKFVAWLAVLLCLCAWQAPAFAQPAVGARLSAADKTDIARIEAYFNRLKTVRAKFLQISSKGGVATGLFYLSRPGKIRFEYDPPTPILIVAGGLFLVYYDKELEQVTHVLLNSTPIGVLVREKVTLSGDLTVTALARGPGILGVRLVETDDAEKGSITLIFSDKPLSLRKWVVTDAQGARTTVSLSDVRLGLPLDPELFEFTDPTPEETE